MSDPAFIEFKQSTGELTYCWRESRVEITSHAWAGNHAGKNNPAMQDVRCVGPLPQGKYFIEQPVTHPHLGPFAMHLIPDSSNQMFGRDAFYIHGPSMGNNRGQESMGCIIADRQSRENLWATGARELRVVA